MQFKLITSNIRFDNPKDKHHSWAKRRPVLSKIINRFNPDLMGTQEGLKPQLTGLESELENLTIADKHREWITNRMYPCIWYNRQTITLLDSGDSWLSLTPQVPGSSSFESAFPRLCTWIKGKFISNNFEFFYANLHLDNVLESTRKQQAQVLINEIKKNNTNNLPLIITGDFNESPKKPARHIVEKNFPQLQDPWKTLMKPEVGTHHSFDGISKNTERIDWMMVQKDIKCLSIQLDKTVIDGIYPSDHFPITGIFEIQD